MNTIQVYSASVIALDAGRSRKMTFEHITAGTNLYCMTPIEYMGIWGTARILIKKIAHDRPITTFRT